MNIVKSTGMVFLCIAIVNVALAGSPIVTGMLVLAGVWVYLIGGLSG